MRVFTSQVRHVIFTMHVRGSAKKNFFNLDSESGKFTRAKNQIDRQVIA